MARRAITTLLLAILVGVAALMLVPQLLGLERYVITGGSMEPTIKRGSLVFDRVVAAEDLRRGDVVTYLPPAGEGPGTLVTHRIVWRGRDAKGRLGFRTKGDANASVDPWRFSLGARQAKVVLAIPYAGYVLDFLSGRTARMLLIGLPALLVAIAVLAGLWRDAGAEARTA